MEGWRVEGGEVGGWYVDRYCRTHQTVPCVLARVPTYARTSVGVRRHLTKREDSLYEARFSIAGKHRQRFVVHDQLQAEPRRRLDQRVGH